MEFKEVENMLFVAVNKRTSTQTHANSQYTRTFKLLKKRTLKRMQMHNTREHVNCSKTYIQTHANAQYTSTCKLLKRPRLERRQSVVAFKQHLSSPFFYVSSTADVVVVASTDVVAVTAVFCRYN